MSRVSVTCAVLIATVAGCGGQTTTTSPAESRSEPSSRPATIATREDEPPTSRPILGMPAGFVLAPKATYTAKQANGEVTIRATGENPTGGYEVKLVQSPLRIWPPQYMLGHKKPEGIVTQAFTPFDVSASFKAGEAVKQVVVSDAAGKHTVAVEQ